jgi:hypothetical protein
MIKIKNIRPSFFEIISFLDKNDLNYWVGRGLIQMIAKKLIEDEPVNHDIDFHILYQDRERLIENLKLEGYKITDSKDYKMQILGKSDNRRIEFVFLFPEGNRLLYHRDKGLKFSCPTELFGDEYVTITNIKVKVPSPLQDYLDCIYQEN